MQNKYSKRPLKINHYDILIGTCPIIPSKKSRIFTNFIDENQFLIHLVFNFLLKVKTVIFAGLWRRVQSKNTNTNIIICRLLAKKKLNLPIPIPIPSCVGFWQKVQWIFANTNTNTNTNIYRLLTKSTMNMES